MGQQISCRLTCSSILLLLFSLVIIPIKLHAVLANDNLFELRQHRERNVNQGNMGMDGITRERLKDNIDRYRNPNMDDRSVGKAHISYYDYTNVDLKYATNARAAWVTTTVDSNGYVGWYTSIALDTAGKAHISYYNNTNDDLRYATNASGTWVTTTVDSSGDVGWHTSIALDTAGKAHISYLDYTNGDLKYATNASGTWITTTVDSRGDVGWDTSIALDTAGKAHISYYDNTKNGDLKYATNASGTWVTTTVDSRDVGWYTSIALDTAGKAHISYIDYTYDDLKYATNARGTWVTATVDSRGNVGVFGGYASIALDTAGKAHISYYEDYPNNDLKYATNASGIWVTTTVDSSGNVGKYASIALDTAGKAHISYFKDYPNNGLKYATNATTSVCDGEVKTVETDTGDFKLLKLASKVVTVTVTDGGGCPVADVQVSATIKGAGKKRIGISPPSKTTGENGNAVFTITAKEKTGRAKVTFKVGSVTEQITVTVVKE